MSANTPGGPTATTNRPQISGTKPMDLDGNHKSKVQFISDFRQHLVQVNTLKQVTSNTTAQ